MSKGMQYTRLGRTGLTVSRICLGCMTYGVPERGAHPWTLPEDQSRPLIRLAVERGINFFKLVVQSPQGEMFDKRLPLKDYLQIVAATNFKQRVRKTMEYYHADRLNRRL